MMKHTHSSCKSQIHPTSVCVPKAWPLPTPSTLN